MTAESRPRHLLDFAAWPRERIEALLETTEVMAQVLQRPVKRVPALQGFTVATLFFEDSTRTRLSFERAARAQSADVMAFAKGGSSLSKGESLRDTVETLDALQVDLFVVRHPAAGAAHQVASWTDAAVVNAGDGRRAHPTQALLDAYAYKARTGRAFDATRLTIVGDVTHSRVARSAAEAFATLGADVVLSGPPTLVPRELGALPGVRIEPRLDAALEGAHAVMALRLQQERMASFRLASAAAYAARYQVTEERLAACDPEVVVLHPGPMNRDVELASTVADGPRSLVREQVAAGVPVRMAVLYHLLVGKGER
ncbi:MAG: aspartate carbamoyltransferase catalytic subunit [Trueperaceae bacterium]